ncbi:MAG: hypothetical protein R3A79_07490 [Nannocystaceae bacterium]
MLWALIPLAIAGALVVRTRDDALIARLAAGSARALRPAPLAPTLAAFALFAAAVYVGARALALPAELATPLVGLCVYLPATFLLFCDVLLVGPRREALWVLYFLALCVLSVELTGALALPWLVGLGVAGTLAADLSARRDPAVSYMRGLFYSYLRGRPRRALRHFARALAARPGDVRTRYHAAVAAHRADGAALPEWSRAELAVVRADPLLPAGFDVDAPASWVAGQSDMSKET